ncbi:hypothetical protein MCAG_05516 [Micromonospora sp. ATCC 39149]|nr:hypothetical protein MCAG_05516 [Micromonospora sp. ATCC 39149]
MRYTQRGVKTYRWSTDDGRYREYDQVHSGGESVLRAGAREVKIAAGSQESTATYDCAADRLTLRTDDGGAWSEETFVRSPA